MNGCNAYADHYQIALGETGVKRVLLSSTVDTYFVQGSCVSVGTGYDRGQNTCYSTLDITPIQSIETVTIDEVNYIALNFAIETTIDTTTDLYVTTQPWQTGATDEVQGNDGSPINNVSNKEPFKIQGIELMLGVGEIAGSEVADQNANMYTLYSNRKASEITPDSSPTNRIEMGIIDKYDGNDAWFYIAEAQWGDQEKYFVPKQINATSTTGYRCATYLSSVSGARECYLLGFLDRWAFTGLFCLILSNGLATVGWYISGRACGTAGNRGEFQA